MDNESGAQRHALIVELESRRILHEVECASLARAINSPHTDARARQASIQRLDYLKRELQKLGASLRLLRDEPATKDSQQNSAPDFTALDTAPDRCKKL